MNGEGGEARFEAWSRFVSTVESFQEVAATIRVQAPEARMPGPFRQRDIEFPLERATAVLDASEQVEAELRRVDLDVDSPPLGLKADRAGWLLEEQLLASAAIDFSLAADMFQLEWLCPPAVDAGEDEEFQVAQPPNPLQPSPRFAPVPVALSLLGGTFGLLQEARPLFVATAAPIDAERIPVPGVDPLPFEWLNRHHALAAARAHENEFPEMDDEIERAIAQLVAESRETALAFGSLPLTAFSAELVETALGKIPKGLFELAQNWKGWRRPALNMIARGLRKLRRVSELGAPKLLETALEKIESAGFTIWLSDIADRRADELLRRLASASPAQRRIRENLARGMPFLAWKDEVWQPVLGEFLPRHVSSQKRARKVAAGLSLTAPFLSTVGLAVGPPAMLAAAACGLGYSVVGLADRLDAYWLGRLGRHQGLPSLVEQHARQIKRPGPKRPPNR